jgi:hypothetical protein
MALAIRGGQMPGVIFDTDQSSALHAAIVSVIREGTDRSILNQIQGGSQVSGPFRARKGPSCERIC